MGGVKAIVIAIGNAEAAFLACGRVLRRIETMPMEKALMSIGR
jgi:hypothetical protein